VQTSWAGHSYLLAKEFSQEGYTHIIAVGGDGTLHEVINGVLNSGNTPTVGLLPSGSGNDFAKTLNGPDNLEEVFDYIQQGYSYEIDAGKVRFMSSNGESEERFFIYYEPYLMHSRYSYCKLIDIVLKCERTL
ncbi:MAG: acylglycerol kinase family protein, partial [Bacteroidota bacterium]